MTKKYQLKNGLNVILTESHKSPVVSVQMWVRTGSADEKKGEEGISHFIEHLVFKGTRKFGVGEIASTIEGSGGELNAYTSFDQTVFYVTISKEFIDTGLLAIAEMMGFPNFDPQEIDNEREVVIEEIKRGKDSLSRKASELLFQTNYTKHPYGIPVIGYDKNIRTLKTKKIVDFFHSRYAPRNMFLVVTGNFETTEMKKKVNQLFSEFKDYKIKKVKRNTEVKQKKSKIAVENANFEQSMAYLSWKIPNIKHKDIPALDVLAMILGQGDTSRLVQKMRIEKAVVNSVGSSSFTPMDEGLFIVSMSYAKENLNEALTDIQTVLEEILTQPVTSDEIKKAILNIASEEYYSMETVDGLSRKVGSLEFYFKDLKAQDKFLKAAQKLTAKDIITVARKYLNSQTLNVSVVTNDEVKKTKQIITKWVENYHKKLKKLKNTKVESKKIQHSKFNKTKLSSKKVETEKLILKNGVTLLLRQHQDTHVISAKAAYLGGIRSENQNIDGLTEVLGRTWTCGTKNRTENQIYQEIESLAAGISPVSGRNSLGLGLDILNNFEKKGLDLFLDILTNPLFSNETIVREKQVQLEQIKSRNDNPAQSCMRLFMDKMFAEHPYSRDLLGDADSLKKIHHEEIHDYWVQTANRKNLTLAISGNFDSALWKKELEKKLEVLPEGVRFKKFFETKKMTQDATIYESSAKEQSHVVYGFRGLTLNDEERYTLQIIQSILAGQGGRLFIELRDKNSLAYSVSPMRMEGVDTGYFGAYIGCSPEKVQKAIKMMKEQFDKLVQERTSEAEIERAKKYLIGHHDIDLQRTSSVASAILYNDIYDIDYNEPFTSTKHYQAVTAQGVQKLAEKIFKQNSVISVVGPENPFKV